MEFTKELLIQVYVFRILLTEGVEANTVYWKTGSLTFRHRASSI